jgi:glycosyltransferase involved in cell wall biosynthesis
MIERDESRVLPRSLASFLAIQGIDPTYCIFDGDSRDSSRDLIPKLMGGIPGEVHLSPQPKPLTNFASARNEAIAQAKGMADWMFFLDADDEIITEPGFVMPPLEGDAYRVLIKCGDLEFWRTVLVSTRKDWRFVGRLHECLGCAEPFLAAKPLNGIWIQVHVGEGARSANPRQKFLDDAAVLRQCLNDDPNDLRSLFYLAQSMRDAGDLPEALDLYRERGACVEGWDEETYFAKLQTARIMGWLDYPMPEVVNAFLSAYWFRPSRAESLGLLAEYLRSKSEWAFAAAMAKLAMQVPRPNDSLFVMVPWYEWRSQDEFAISSYYAGDFSASRNACLSLLASSSLPKMERYRVQENLSFAAKRIAELMIVSKK